MRPKKTISLREYTELQKARDIRPVPASDPASSAAKMVRADDDGDEAMEDIEQQPTTVLKQTASNAEDVVEKPETPNISDSTNVTNMTETYLAGTTQDHKPAGGFAEQRSITRNSAPVARRGQGSIPAVPTVVHQAVTMPSAVSQRPGPQLGRWNKMLNHAMHHIDLPRWKPQNPGSLPVTDDQHLYWTEEIARELRNVTFVRDSVQCRKSFAKFAPGGIYNSVDIKITAVSLVQQTKRLYTHGSTSLFFKDPANLPQGIDANMTFESRIRAFLMLVRDFKKAADYVMCGQFHEEFLSNPTTAWHGLNDALRMWQEAVIKPTGTICVDPITNNNVGSSEYGLPGRS